MPAFMRHGKGRPDDAREDNLTGPGPLDREVQVDVSLLLQGVDAAQHVLVVEDHLLLPLAKVPGLRDERLGEDRGPRNGVLLKRVAVVHLELRLLATGVFDWRPQRTLDELQPTSLKDVF